MNKNYVPFVDVTDVALRFTSTINYLHEISDGNLRQRLR